MGYPLGPTLANIFLCNYEDIWLRNYSLECKAKHYKRYVEDIFDLFHSESQVESFKHFMDTCHPKIKFTFEKEKNKCFNFLDVKVIRENNFLSPQFTVNPLLMVFKRILIVTFHRIISLV